MRRRSIVAALLLAIGLTGPAALADLAHPRVVSDDPVDWTPHVRNGTVRAFAVVGSVVVVGGDFTDVTDSSGRTGYERWFLFAFDRHTGAVREDFVPDLDGPVYALAAGPDGTVYVGGDFTAVNGVRQRGLTRLRVADGSREDGFGASIGWGDVRTLAVHGPWLYAGGTFVGVNGVPRSGLARVDVATGAVDQGFDARLSAPRLSRVKVEDLAVSPDGSRIVAVGALTMAAGLPRVQLVMLSADGAVVDWHTDAYRARCRAGFETYLRGVDFAPSGAYFVVVTTGRATSPNRRCDTAARFEVGGAGPHDPTWVNHTGGDSLYAVAITGSAVYVAGHQRWMDNPFGREDVGPGAVSRPGIAAVDPVTGRALPWNPTRTPRGVGVRALVATPDGLLVGSDTERLGREYHARLGLFPLA